MKINVWLQDRHTSFCKSSAGASIHPKGAGADTQVSRKDEAARIYNPLTEKIFFHKFKTGKLPLPCQLVDKDKNYKYNTFTRRTSAVTGRASA